METATERIGAAMEAITRPTIALTAATVVAFGSALGAAPTAIMASPSVYPATSAVVAQDIMLTGFIANIYNDIESVVSPIVYSVSDLIGAVPLVGPPIANQIDILYGYGQAAVADTVYWVDDLVTPLVNGNFWPLSGAPGNYLAGAVNSTIDWGQALVDTAVGFVGAEIDYFFGWIPNIPSIINNVINTIKNIVGWFNIPNIINNVVNAVQNVINWIIGWIPGPFAAVATPAAAAAIATAPRSVARRAAAAPASATKAAPVGKPEAQESSSPKGASAAGDPAANVAGDGETKTSAAHEDRRSARAGRASASADRSKSTAKQSRSHARSAGAAKTAARSAE